MPSLVEDPWVNQQAVTHDITEIEDCAIAVDATYYLQQLLESGPSHEPLLPALGGLTGIQMHIETDLSKWEARRITPFFIFDGQSITGQDGVFTSRALKAVEKTDQAWDLYFNGEAESAVSAFGANTGAFPRQALYPLLQGILKKRKLHFLVTPYNASAQLAYFDKIDSDQCAGIMGPQELLLYPIRDSIIRSLDWQAGTLTAISKKQLLKAAGVSESLFIDSLLMTGTSFLPRFPPLQDGQVNPRTPTIMDAVNMLRASDKAVAACCASFNDILLAQDPDWLDKYRKARMAVNHFIYVAEDGAVTVHEFDKLTGDNFEYLGLQLPHELFHYLNTGLIGPRILSWITHLTITVVPTLDGVSSPEYRKLIAEQLLPIKETAMGLFLPRLNRGIQHREVTVKVWYDAKYARTINFQQIPSQPSTRSGSWNISQATAKATFPEAASGSLFYELSALQKSEFVQKTFHKDKVKGGLESSDAVISIALWKFLHLRHYVNDAHELTNWGNALAAAFSALQPTVKKYPEVPNLYEAALVAVELVRFDLLNAKNKHEELRGLPMNGSDEDKENLLLVCRAATLLKLRHMDNGYTGPLSKNLLAFHSQIAAVRDADRDLLEAIVATMFMFGQAKRERDDGWEIGHRLPFLHDPDVAMGIAVKTLLDEVPASEPAQERAQRKKDFPSRYVPYATHFEEDLDIAFNFFGAIHACVKALDKEVSAADKAVWERASKWLELRR